MGLNIEQYITSFKAIRTLIAALGVLTDVIISNIDDRTTKE